MSEKLVCVVGISGSGKTTLTDAACAKYGLTSVQSMTTRPPRFPGEPGHVFVTPEEFHKYDMVAYTMFDGNEYGVPAEMLDDANFYVIDIDGVKTLRQRYNGKKLCVIYLDLPTDEAIERMRKRGDSEEKISVRLANDAVKFADVDGLAPDYVIDAGRSYEEVTASFEEVLRKIGVIKRGDTSCFTR